MFKFLLKTVFSFALTVLIARWLYMESALISPDIPKVIDKVLNTIELPTHNKWSSQEVSTLVIGTKARVFYLYSCIGESLHMKSNKCMSIRDVFSSSFDKISEKLT